MLLLVDATTAAVVWADDEAAASGLRIEGGGASGTVVVRGGDGTQLSAVVTPVAGSPLVTVWVGAGQAPAAAGSAEPDLIELRSRATDATSVAFTVSDPDLPDNPLLWANRAFTSMTGYELDEVVGTNCRFLQGPGTDPSVVADIGSAVAERRSVTRVLLNYRKDGTPFWNQLAVSPLVDPDGRPAGFVGVQLDVTDRVRTRQRLALTAEVTAELADTFATSVGVERLADLVVPALADWVVINVHGDEPADERVVVRHRHGMQVEAEAYVRMQPPSLVGHETMERVLATGEAVLAREVDPVALRDRLGDELGDVVERLGVRSVIYAALVARQSRVLGTFVLIASDRVFGQDDVDMAADIGRRAGAILDNARLYEAEHRVSEVLQRSLLPELPDISGVEVAAAYLPANASNDVGGDFYEVLHLPDGAVGFAVGDVVGHDITAAAAMGHLRGLLRASAWDLVDGASPGPARVLGRVDDLVQALADVTLATAVYVRADAVGERWRLTWSNAGHPYPLVRTPDGAVTRLEGAGGLILGVDAGLPRDEATMEVPAGSVVVAYTDGLVERRGRSLDEGIDQAAHLLATSGAPDVSGLVRDVMADLGGRQDDDVAVVALRLGAPGALAPPPRRTGAALDVGTATAP